MSFQVAVFNAAATLNRGVGALFGATTPPEGPTEPQLRPGLDPTDVSPGLLGFIAMFVLAVAVIFMMLSMNKKMRKVGHSTDSSHRVSAEFDGERPTRRPRPAASATAAAVTSAAPAASAAATGTPAASAAAAVTAQAVTTAGADAIADAIAAEVNGVVDAIATEVKGVADVSEATGAQHAAEVQGSKDVEGDSAGKFGPKN